MITFQYHSKNGKPPNITSLTLKYISVRLGVLNSALERFLSKITVTDSGCWEWTAGLNNSGYGQFSPNHKKVLVHRFIYEYYNGQICPDLELDHKCRNRKCGNPVHLRQVTHKENVLSGKSPSAVNARKTHCNNGHEFTTENTYLKNNIVRICLICRRKYDKQRYANLA